jgi:carboxyl-terminal processing protease
MRSRAVVSGLVLGTALVSGGWFMQRGLLAADAPPGAGRGLLLEVMSVVQRSYVDTVSQATLYQHAVDGLLLELHDPHSAMLSADRLARLAERTTGRYGGVGIQIDVRDGWITVVSPLPGTPAEHAGIQTGDRVVSIEGRSTRNWTPDEATKALRGDPGSTVGLTVERPGIPQPLTFSLQRREIQSHAVRHALMLRGDVGYVDLLSFSEDAAEELHHAVDSLRTAGMHTLLLDLRSDPGGLLDQGVAVSDLFLDAGQTIVSMKGRTRDANRSYADRAPQAWPDLRLMVLVDSGSASASEIVAGALQDHDRAVLLGTTTFGKGSAQSLFRTVDGGAIKLTTALWFTPSGRSINRPLSEEADDDLDRVGPSRQSDPAYRTDAGRNVKGGGGITPDVVVPDPAPTEADRAFERALGNKVPVFRDVLASYALSLRAKRAVTSPFFPVTPAMREELHDRLSARGVHIDRAVYDAATPLVDRWIGSQVARFALGERAEFERATRDDRVVQRALQLAGSAKTQQELLRAARGRQ